MTDNQTLLHGSITDLTESGEGFLRMDDGYVVFVPGGLPGDQITYVLTSRGTRYGRGKLISIDSPSEDRTVPVCPYFGQCGGCQLQNLSYTAQLKIKQKHTEAAIQRIGRISAPVLPIIGFPEEQFRYRNKISLPLRKNGAGMYALHSHDFIPIEDCLLAPEGLSAILKIVRDLLRHSSDNHIPDQLTIRWNQDLSQIMLLFYGRTPSLPNKDTWIRHLLAIPNIVSLYYLPHTADLHNIPEEEYNQEKAVPQLLAGIPSLDDSIGHCRVKVSPLSFYQVNPIQRVRLYDQISKYVSIVHPEILMDVFCGAGTIGLYVAQSDTFIYGVESVPQAIDDANTNARLNSFYSASFICNHAEKQIPYWKKEGLHPDLAILDPPRQGCDKSLLEALSSLRSIIYVSCNPATLSRDLRILSDAGFSIESIQPFDLFPQTMHVETVCCLYHQKKDFISVPYEPRNAEYLKKN